MERLGAAARTSARGASAVPAVRIVGFNVRQPHRAVPLRVHAAAQPAVADPAGSGGSGSAAAGPSGERTAAASSGSSSSSSSLGAGPTFDLACPICQTTHLRVQNTAGRPTGDLHCPRCARSFASNAVFADLTLTSGVEQRAYQQKNWGGTTIFQSPVVSFVYERGWRQGFAWAGFPGADKEFELAMDFLQPAFGQVLLDMSCGSGLFSRRFLKSGRFAGVIAADYSESMLGQAKSFIGEDPSINRERYLLLRADVGRMPFATGSVAAVHAGAAIHCWPNPQAALAEVSRVLRPGGVFVASTFLNFTAPLGQLLGSDELVAPLGQLEPNPRAYKWWTEAELKDLCAAVGLQDFRRSRSNRFIMFCARKPEAV